MTTTQIVHFVMKNLQMNPVFVYPAIVSTIHCTSVHLVKNVAYFLKLAQFKERASYKLIP